MRLQFRVSSRLWVLSGLVCIVAFGCARKEAMFKPQGQPKTKLSIRLAKWEPFPGSKEFAIPEGKEYVEPGSGKKLNRLFLHAEAAFTNEDVTGTSVSRLKGDLEDYD